MSVGLPTTKDVRDLLGELVGKDVEVSTGKAADTGRRNATAVADYVDAANHTTATSVMDLSLAASLAGAFALLPARVMQEAVKEGTLSAMHLEVLHEVFNVMASLFNTPGATHCKLRAVYPPNAPVPAALGPIAWGMGSGRLDLNASVAGYGKGAIALVRA